MSNDFKDDLNKAINAGATHYHKEKGIFFRLDGTHNFQLYIQAEGKFISNFHLSQKTISEIRTIPKPKMEFVKIDITKLKDYNPDDLFHNSSLVSDNKFYHISNFTGDFIIKNINNIYVRTPVKDDWLQEAYDYCVLSGLLNKELLDEYVKENQYEVRAMFTDLAKIITKE